MWRLRTIVQAGLLSLPALASCAHDEFPGRLKRGCTSERDCRQLVAEAVSRLNECDSYLLGTRLKHDLRRARARCHIELVDCDVALARAREWARLAQSPAVFVIGWVWE